MERKNLNLYGVWTDGVTEVEPVLDDGSGPTVAADVFGYVVAENRKKAVWTLIKAYPNLYRDACADMRDMPKTGSRVIVKNVRLAPGLYEFGDGSRVSRLLELIDGLNEHGEPIEEFWPELKAERENSLGT